MAVKLPMTCSHWSQPSISKFSAVLSTPKRRSFASIDGALTWNLLRPALLRSRATDLLRRRTAVRSCSGSFSDEEFSEAIEELVAEEERSSSMFLEIVPESIERKANCFDLPLSLRIIKRKKQWQEGFRQVGESAYCSVKRAFSNMVFIIRELHSYTLLGMREMIFYEDFEGILVRVQNEMHASFVWLFQKVFSHTPTLMVYVMILLANYSVHSMASASSIPVPSTSASSTYGTAMEVVSLSEDQTHHHHGIGNFNSFKSKTLLGSNSDGRKAVIGGNSGGGGKYRPTSSGTDGDDGTFKEAFVFGQVLREEELRLWNSIEEEATRMQGLDLETMLRFVSPIDATIESDEDDHYSKTELLYRTGLAHEPNNTLLLANYAQFLFTVAQDYDRAEEYFKRAVTVEPKDAESLNKYATFLWRARNDLWAAEQTYQAAVDAEPNNSFYAADYAHFLWNTGGEDTCFPLDDGTPHVNNNDVV
ncbi:unnamed protein product [Cuscuta epithymum]|uniref:Uncharacterized protein n=1 Tax=Cuscuta epithymum TaxID=186058 RepID=A0AAV0FT26_9ASTE|nr:unnamed protein product [Cuscuta epithymum]